MVKKISWALSKTTEKQWYTKENTGAQKANQTEEFKNTETAVLKHP